MESSRQALHTNGKPFSNFEIIFPIIGRKQKNIQTNSEAGILVKVQCVIHISMDSSRRALQTNGKLFSNIRNNFLKIIVALGINTFVEGGGGHLC